ncbi:hypothetical protein BWQ96_07293 [Gracilariopsis chorda]|uniref:Uncharacterized protein n=1 Tax=Gracilariopsis chorda TaxID=448386 RepID=A0A2V3ILQ2_9FLOR|nr:hypothetical protein BWQ96_07293 [Gracilariopsis chorda]|eukprot:PXF42989.1 hypothetical protein BWQ96_07293 [Gracilariopsis chorda]
MTLHDDLATWIKEELPTIQVPSEETLKALTEREEGKSLWQTVVKRFRTEQHAKEDRSFLVLTSRGDRSETNKSREEELQRIRDETRDVERDIQLLREQLEADAEEANEDDGDLSASEVDNAVMEGVLDIITDREEELTHLLGLLQQSPWGDLDDSSESNSGDEGAEADAGIDQAVRRWCEKGRSEWETAENELRIALESSWGADVGGSLLALLNESEATLAAAAPAEVSSTEAGAEEMARDAQLRAFSRLRTLEREHQAAEERGRTMKNGIDKSRVLWAHVQAERAALASATEPRQIKSGSAAERRAKRAVRRGKEAVKELEGCAKELCTGSFALLKSASDDINDVMTTGKQLESKLSCVASIAEDILNRVETEVGCKAIEHREQAQAKAVETGSNSTADLRRSDAERWSAQCRRVVVGLSTRNEMLCEQRADALQGIEHEVVPVLRAAVNEAKECRDIRIAPVTDEMRNWTSQPAQEAAPWLFVK